MFTPSYRRDPYLWVHLAGLAALPLLLELCLLGLAAGYPIFPPVIELGIVAIAGAAPVLWMQWTRPFYIFSLLAVALAPQQLTELQRRLLRYFRTSESRIIAVLVPIALTWILWSLYKFAPIVSDVTPVPQNRLVGLIVAAIGFFLCNLFVQVPASVLRVLLVKEPTFAQTEPYPVAQVRSDFLLVGWQLSQLLPKLIPAPAAPRSTSSAVTPTPAIATPAAVEPDAEAIAALTADPDEVTVPDLDVAVATEVIAAPETATASDEPESAESPAAAESSEQSEASFTAESGESGNGTAPADDYDPDFDDGWEEESAAIAAADSAQSNPSEENGTPPAESESESMDSAQADGVAAAADEVEAGNETTEVTEDVVAEVDSEDAVTAGYETTEATEAEVAQVAAEDAVDSEDEVVAEDAVAQGDGADAVAEDESSDPNLAADGAPSGDAITADQPAGDEAGAIASPESSESADSPEIAAPELTPPVSDNSSASPAEMETTPPNLAVSASEAIDTEATSFEALDPETKAAEIAEMGDTTQISDQIADDPVS